MTKDEIIEYLYENHVHADFKIEEMAEDLAEPVRMKGKWIFHERREPVYDLMGTKTWANAYRCSECGFIHTVIEDFGHYSFCPGCGFPMVMEKGEEDDNSNLVNSNL